MPFTCEQSIWIRSENWQHSEADFSLPLLIFTFLFFDFRGFNWILKSKSLVHKTYDSTRIFTCSLKSNSCSEELEKALGRRSFTWSVEFSLFSLCYLLLNAPRPTHYIVHSRPHWQWFLEDFRSNNKTMHLKNMKLRLHSHKWTLSEIYLWIPSVMPCNGQDEKSELRVG